MKSTFSTLAISAALLTASAVSAQAAEAKSPLVSQAQAQLNNLGYYSGHEDGVVGPQTKNALMDFQHRNGLPSTGTLTPETYSLLGTDQRNFAWYGQGNYNGNANWRGGYQQAAWQQQAWMNNQPVPLRFGNMAVQEQVNTGGLRNYAVTLNGQPVLYANNQPAQLRFSRNYTTNGEDSVMFTVYDSASACNAKSYVINVRSDGTYIPAQEVAACSGGTIAWNDTGRYYVSSR